MKEQRSVWSVLGRKAGWFRLGLVFASIGFLAVVFLECDNRERDEIGESGA